MLPLLGRPLVAYSFENAHRAGVDEIVVVVKYRAEQIINEFGIDYRGIRIRYVIQDDPQGLVHAISCARPVIGDTTFMLFLADEILFESRHREMVERFEAESCFAMCGVVEEPKVEEIRKTYSVIQDADGRIYRLIEKPRRPQNEIRGTGNCLFRPEIFDYIDLTPVNPVRQEKELPDLIQCAVDDGHLVKSFAIGGSYVNINSPEDIAIAEREGAIRATGTDGS